MFSRFREAWKQSFGRADEPRSAAEVAVEAAIWDNQIEPLKRYLAAGGNPNATVSQRAGFPARPLAILVYSNEDALSILLNAGASPDSFNPTDGLSLLHMAAQHGKLDLAKRLLALGADPDAKNGFGAGSPLYAASTRGNLEMVSLLLEAGANPNLKNWAGLTPLEAINGLPNGEVCGTLHNRKR